MVSKYQIVCMIPVDTDTVLLPRLHGIVARLGKTDRRA